MTNNKQPRLPDRKFVTSCITRSTVLIPDLANIVAGFGENYTFHAPINTRRLLSTASGVIYAWAYPGYEKMLVDTGELHLVDPRNPENKVPLKRDLRISGALRDYLMAKTRDHVCRLLDPETLAPVWEMRREGVWWQHHTWAYGCFEYGDTTSIVDPRRQSPIRLPDYLWCPIISNDCVYTQCAFNWPGYAPLADVLARGSKAIRPFPSNKAISHYDHSKTLCSDDLLICGFRQVGAVSWHAHFPGDITRVSDLSANVCYTATNESIAVVIREHVFEIRETKPTRWLISEVM